MKPNDLEIRALSPDDDLEMITELLHAAYKPLADQGLKFWVTWQSVEDTQTRFNSGHGYVALLRGDIVGTISLRIPTPHKGCDWLARTDIATFSQFAVSPAHQKLGIGARLLEHIEVAAKDLGVRHLVCDTAETATHLIKYYRSKGFEPVDYVNWGVTNYRSVVLSKELQ